MVYDICLPAVIPMANISMRLERISFNREENQQIFPVNRRSRQPKAEIKNALQVADDEIYLVVNAGCREKDLNHLNKHLEKYTVSINTSP